MRYEMYCPDCDRSFMVLGTQESGTRPFIPNEDDLARHQQALGCDHKSAYVVEPDEDSEICPVCGSELEWDDCWQCLGEGGFHDCGEDVCCCLDKDEITRDCNVCDGEGGYLICPCDHTDEQLRAHEQRIAMRKL